MGFAGYYRHGFDPGALRAKGWPGEVSDIGGWGGGVMNGGARLFGLEATSRWGWRTVARGLIEASHGRLAARREWVTNEKQIVERAGLADEAGLLLVTDAVELEASLRTLRQRLDPETNGIP